MKKFKTISDITIWPFTGLPREFNSPQVKQNLISSLINFVYEWFHELVNYLSLEILGNQEMKTKSQNYVET